MHDPTPNRTRILIVDEHTIADTLSILFRAAKFETAVAYNGAEAQPRPDQEQSTLPLRGTITVFQNSDEVLKLFQS